MTLFEKLMDYLIPRVKSGAAVAFSGGTDSSALLAAAIRASGGHAGAFFFDNGMQPLHAREEAERTAEEIGAPFHVMKSEMWKEPEIRDNPHRRCYFCKKKMYESLLSAAEKYGYGIVLDGNNADDANEYRPGRQALAELKITSPLLECGITKPEVRTLAAELGISCAQKPSSPCMATRLPYGTILEGDLLLRIAKGEDFLHRAGFSNVRLRVYPDGVVVEIPEAKFSEFYEKRAELFCGLEHFGFAKTEENPQILTSGKFDKKE